ncbi:hypothetical protein H9X57_02040 [Flavobacterium piscinae]|uniref:hypothetical protein n=1 Tax=Flavobacterium piscinae TaxID=2506424 RepID=UPI0019C693B2|nr:hypothetical protein [Flavobacterium piscinae]MBC8882621.1 hypothetical protein [Flavobacterium piscinae]
MIYFLSSFKDRKAIIFENEKIIFYLKDKGIQAKINLCSGEEGEKLNFRYLVYTKPKTFIGTEKYTTNKKLMDVYSRKYKMAAWEENKNKQDIEATLEDFKIVQEIKNNKIYFYYYKATSGLYKEITKTGVLDKKMNPFWQYIGADKFLIDIYINEKLVHSKYFELLK